MHTCRNVSLAVDATRLGRPALEWLFLAASLLGEEDCHCFLPPQALDLVHVTGLYLYKRGVECSTETVIDLVLSLILKNPLSRVGTSPHRTSAGVRAFSATSALVPTPSVRPPLLVSHYVARMFSLHLRNITHGNLASESVVQGRNIECAELARQVGEGAETLAKLRDYEELDVRHQFAKELSEEELAKLERLRHELGNATSKQRKANQAYALALDHGMLVGIGKGLMHFKPSKVVAKLPARSKRPC
eukprot:2789824-Amphidinium_carterae.5